MRQILALDLRKAHQLRRSGVLNTEHGEVTEQICKHSAARIPEERFGRIHRPSSNGGEATDFIDEVLGFLTGGAGGSVLLDDCLDLADLVEEAIGLIKEILQGRIVKTVRG